MKDDQEADEEPVAMPDEPATQDEVRALLLSKAKRAARRLGELMECNGRQSLVALGACRIVLEEAMKPAGAAVEDLSQLSDDQLLARRIQTS